MGRREEDSTTTQNNNNILKEDEKNEFKLSLIKSLNGIIIEYTCEYEIIFCVVC